MLGRRRYAREGLSDVSLVKTARWKRSNCSDDYNIHK